MAKTRSSILPPDYQWPMHGGRIIGRILKEHGVKYIFGVMGGHLYAFETGFYEHGIFRLHMRHEQAGAFAADAYARCSRSPGLCYATAGPGVTNAISGINQAFLARSPVVALFGQHPRAQDLRGPFQEAYPEAICSTMTKWTRFVEDGRLIPMYLRKALRECMTYPPGPVAVAMDPRTLELSWEDSELVWDVPQSGKARPRAGGGLPEDIEKAVIMLRDAERPVMVAGDGIWWSDAAAELQELSQLLQIPASCRRMARGSIPEDSPLAIHGSWRTQFWQEADVIMGIGIRLSNLEARGEPPAWPPKAKRIIVHEDVRDAWSPLPAELEIIGNHKAALRQMIDCARSLVKTPPKRTAWLEHLERVRSNFEAGMAESIEEVRDWKPVHAFVLGREIVDFLDPSATVILDSFTGSAHLTDKFKAKFPGQVLDTGESGGVGHGIGMGIGAQLARPGKQVLAMMGDAGMGIDGMDIETAVRYNLPIVYVVYNNSTWIGGCEAKFFQGQAYPWGMLPDIRYDKMFEVLGCHAENVTEHTQIRPALERAFNSGKTAVVNVIADSRVCNPYHLSRPFLGTIRRTVDLSRLPEVNQELILKGYTPEVEKKLRKLGWPPLRVKSKTSYWDIPGSSGMMPGLPPPRR